MPETARAELPPPAPAEVRLSLDLGAPPDVERVFREFLRDPRVPVFAARSGDWITAGLVPSGGGVARCVAERREPWGAVALEAETGRGPLAEEFRVGLAFEAGLGDGSGRVLVTFSDGARLEAATDTRGGRTRLSFPADRAGDLFRRFREAAQIDMAPEGSRILSVPLRGSRAAAADLLACLPEAARFARLAALASGGGNGVEGVASGGGLDQP